MTETAPQKASRQNTPRLAAIDGLRAMAMLMVFTFHTWEFAGRPYGLRVAGVGGQGVDVFIVLSGFCLFFPLCFGENKTRGFDWRKYAARRVRRIVPAYYAAIIYALVAGAIFEAVRHVKGIEGKQSVLPSPLDLLAHVTFTHTLFPSTFFGIVGAFWSLGLEAQFYVLFPLVVWAYSRFGVKVIAGMILLSVGYHAVTYALGLAVTTQAVEFQVVKNFFLGRWIEFAVGMGTALLVARNLQRGIVTPTWKGALMALVGLSIFILPAPNLRPLLTPGAVFNLGRGVMTGMLIYAICTSTRPVAFLWSNKISAFLGFISYSFFLIHQPTILYLSVLLMRFGHMAPGAKLFAVLLVVGFALCLAISYSFFLIFEKPFLKNWPSVWMPKRAGEVR